MTIKNLTGRNFERLCWLAIIIALLILLKHCGSTGASTAKALTDSLRLADKAAHDTASLRQFRYSLDSAHAATARKQAQDSAATAWAKAGELQRQIRALLGRKTTEEGPDEQGYTTIPSPCCELATQLADQVDTIKAREAAKDAAANHQINLATNMVNAQGMLLDEAYERYDKLDSAYLTLEERSRPRGSVWGGVETQIGPVSSVGAYLRYETPRGKEYGIGGGRQQFGWYGSVKVGVKFSFRKKR